LKKVSTNSWDSYYNQPDLMTIYENFGDRVIGFELLLAEFKTLLWHIDTINSISTYWHDHWSIGFGY